MKLEAVVFIFILLSLTLLGGCIHEEKTGTLVIQITDRPSKLNITSAIVNISSVEVHIALGNNENETAGWYTVVNTSKSFDLIKIKDIKELLGSTNLTAGLYTQIRLHINNASATIDGVNYSLTIPSKTIKLIRPFLIKDNKTTTLTLDFDVESSIHPTGHNSYIMRPTIKVIQE